MRRHMISAIARVTTVYAFVRRKGRIFAQEAGNCFADAVYTALLMPPRSNRAAVVVVSQDNIPFRGTGRVEGMRNHG